MACCVVRDIEAYRKGTSPRYIKVELSWVQTDYM